MSGPGEERTVRQEEDRYDTRKVVLVGLGAMAVFAVGIVAATLLLGRSEARVRSLGPEVQPSEVGHAEVGIVIQAPFGRDDRPGTQRSAERARLEGWGWVDRSRGVAHVPIERAIDLAVAELAGAPAPASPPPPSTSPASPPAGSTPPAAGAR